MENNFRITEEKRKQIHDLVLSKYGEEDYKLWNEGSLMINDKEISDITGIVTYTVPVGKKSAKEAEKDISEMMDKYKSYNIKPYNDKPIGEDFWIPNNKLGIFKNF